ncbi:hypothetical protein OROHE_014820 [Orobanche hederae]
MSDSCLVVCGSKHQSRPLRSAPLQYLSAMRGRKGKGKGKRTSFSPLKFSESSWPDSADFWANYLNGTIPNEWASTKLELSLENNMFNRQVPASLGKLVNLVVLVLNTNNLTGSIPAELSHLPKLNEMCN